MKMKTKTINEKVQMYLTKTSQHLFLVNDKTLQKIIPVITKNGVCNILVLGFDIDGNFTNLCHNTADSFIKYYGDNAKCVLSHNLFGAKPNPTRHAVRNRKAITVQIEEIKKAILVADAVSDKIDFSNLLKPMLKLAA